MRDSGTMNLTHLPGRLQQNLDKTLRLALVPGIPTSLMENVIQGLNSNVSIQDVCLTICCGAFATSAQQIQLHAFMDAVLRLPHLQCLVVRGTRTTRGGIASLPITCISNTTVRSKKFTSMSLRGLLITGGSRDFENLAVWLFTLRNCLQELKLLGVGLSDRQTTSALTPLLQAAANLPLLKNLEISDTFTTLGALQDDKLPLHLFRSSKTGGLERLSISDFLLTDQALASVFSMLRVNTQLREVALSGDLPFDLAPQFTRLLETNKTLTAIALRLDSLEDDRVNRELVKALGKSSSLEVVSLCSFCGSSLSAAFRQALATMLETNTFLEYLHVPAPYSDHGFWDHVRLYLGLNAAGRKDLVLEQGSAQDEQRDQYVELLKQASVDINSSFYLLQTNPGLCSPPSASSATKSTRTVNRSSAATEPLRKLPSTDAPMPLTVWNKSSKNGVKRQLSERQSMSEVLRMTKSHCHRSLYPADVPSARTGLANLFLR